MDKSKCFKVCSTSDYECSGTQKKVASLECLPNEILAKISSYLDYYDLDQLKAVNRRFNKICQLSLMDSYYELLKNNNNFFTYLMKQYRSGNHIITSPKLFVILEQFFKDLEFPKKERNCPPFVSGAKLDFIFRVCEYSKSNESDSNFILSSDLKLFAPQNETFNFFIEKLPNEMLAHITSYLNFEQLDNLKQVNERFGKICKLHLVKQYLFLLKKHRKLLIILTDKFQRGPQYLKSPRSRILFFQLNHCLKSPHDQCPIEVSGELLRIVSLMCDYFRSKAELRQLSAFWQILEKSLVERRRTKPFEAAMRKQKRAKIINSPAPFVLNTSGYFLDKEPEKEKFSKILEPAF